MAGKTQISFAQSAVSDLEDIQAYYDGEGAAAAGRRLIEELVSAIERLAEHPKSGRIVPEFNMEYLREVIKPPFRIVHRCDKRKVRIVRICRSERILKLP